MRSIRRSMTVYLLVILAATLGAVGWIVHHRTIRSLKAQSAVFEQSLAAREAAAEARQHNRYEDRCREEREQVDQALRLEARGLADVMQREYFVRYSAELKRYREIYSMLQPGFGPNPFAQTLWVGVGNNGEAFWNPHKFPTQLFRSYVANLPIPEECLQQVDAPNERSDFFQINTAGGRAWYSKSLEGRNLPFDPRGLESTTLYAEEASNAVLSHSGEPVRRVVLRTPLFNSPPSQQPGPRPPPRPGTPDRGSGGKGSGGWPPFNPPPPPVPTPDSLPKLYIQVARPQSKIDEAFTRFSLERDAELEKSLGEIRYDRDRFFSQIQHEERQLDIVILGGVLAAFLALAIGGPLLIGRSLKPVGELSLAVSAVSEKDFNLPHDGKGLPSELAPIHARLTQTLDLLRRAFAREKQSVADISHELRTPIASLLATIDVSLRKPRSPDQYRSTLEECRIIAKQLGQLVERIMILASLDAGNARTLTVRTDAADLAAACAALLRPLALAHGLTLTLDAEGPLELDTDPDKLREVLVNLLHNAIEYNAPGGTIELNAWAEGEAIIMEVKDTGIGMTPEVQEKIFERFYRADAARSSTGVHAGLGLAIVKEYVERLNGTIVVTSAPGVGTTFRVTLPAALEDAVTDSGMTRRLPVAAPLVS